jgi:hypothetical protein
MVHVVVGARQRSIERARLSFIASQPREGRVMRQVRRAFVANDRRPLSMSEIWPWVFPGIKQAKHWQRWSVRRALLKIAKPIGRSPCGRGRPAIWSIP